MGITEFQQQDNDPLRGPFPDHPDKMVGTVGQTAVLGGTHHAVQIAPGNGLYGSAVLSKSPSKDLIPVQRSSQTTEPPASSMSG